MFYSEGNFYHDIYMEELANLAETSHKNVSFFKKFKWENWKFKLINGKMH